uniref:Putative LOV domain-containing protein n=1 Tax=Rhodochaete parvula TaxID=110510 RepID=A0A126WYI3_9RHOD|nr:putative LOV domain-containing protein [Rhodochaete parvula]
MFSKPPAVRGAGSDTEFQPKVRLHEQDYEFCEKMMAKNQMFVITDPKLPDHPIVYASREFLDFTGYSSEDIVGKNCRFLQGRKTEPEDIQEISNAIKDKGDCKVGLINYKKNGDLFFNEFFMTTMHKKRFLFGSKVKNPTYFIGVQTESTEEEYKAESIVNNFGQVYREEQRDADANK